jgi:uronate dehydrogenase
MSSTDIATQTWALTGAAGMIGTTIRPGLAARVGALRLLDSKTVEPHAANEECRAVDLRDRAQVEAALAGAHGVVHLGGIADEADFYDLVDVNVIGTFHVLEAARRGGVTRVVNASSNRLTGFYETTTMVTTELPPRPDGFYGVSKVATEALGRLYADKFGLEVACLRIGSFEQTPQDERQLSTWLSPGDCLAAVLAAMTASPLSYAAFYAVSANTRRWWSLDEGRLLGFEPRDDAETYAPSIIGREPVDAARELRQRQSGAYTSPEYSLARQHLA